MAYVRVPRGSRRPAILQTLRLYANERTNSGPLSLTRGVEVEEEQFPSLGRIDPSHASHPFFNALFGNTGLINHADLAVFTA